MVVWDPAAPAELERCLEEARGADLVVKASGIGVHDALLEARVLELRRPGNRVAFWDVDAPATLERLARDPADPFRALVPRYDHVFTYGGGDPVVRAYRALGARACVPIYNALDPARTTPSRRIPASTPTSRFSGTGCRTARPASRSSSCAPPRCCPLRRFLLGGAGWDDRPTPPNVRVLGHVGTADHNAFNCTPLAVLNVSRDSMARNGFSPATRVFEAAGAAACLVTDDVGGARPLPRAGRRGAPRPRRRRGRGGCSPALTPARARRIGLAARRRVLAEHTYARRAEEVEAALGISAAAPPRETEDAAGGRAARGHIAGAAATRPDR